MPIPADDLTRALVQATADSPNLPHIGLVGDTYTVLLTGQDTAGKYCLIDMLVPPAGGPPPHRHDFEEAFILLEGKLDFTFRGETKRVPAPGTGAVPANAPHAFRNASDRQAHMLCLCAPAGQQEYFALVGSSLPSRDAPQP